MTPKEALKKYFGYDTFKEGQEEIITTILQGKNSLAILPTGGGKSICYQIPALLGKRFSIVISPLIALMKDQVDALNKIKRSSAFINSTLDYAQTEEVFQQIGNGNIKLLYVAPEKLENSLFAQRIKNLNPNYLFVDEAHCISEWGHNFRPSYRKIQGFCEFTGITKISAFTATATPEVREDIVKQLNLNNPAIFIRGFERENLHLNAFHTSKKKEKTLELMKSHETPAIIYTSTRKNAEDAAEFLRLHGISVSYYHAGMSPEMRRLIQDDFLNDRTKVIAATNAFGMGIDKKDIRLIIHFNMPGTIENYYQEIGRAGRDGKNSYIFLLYTERDRDIQEFFINNSYPSREQLKFVYNNLCNFAGAALGQQSDKEVAIDKKVIKFFKGYEISRGLLESAITILENNEYLSYSTDFKNDFYVQFSLDPKQIKRYIQNIADAVDKDLLMLLLRSNGDKIFESKVKVDVEFLSKEFDNSTKTVIGSLKSLANTGIIDIDVPSFSPVVKMSKPRVHEKYLTLDYDKLKKNYEHSLKKLHAMLDYTFSDDCRFKYILSFFGEDVGEYRCGRCDNCTGGKQVNKAEESYLRELIKDTLNEAETPLKQNEIINILTGKDSEVQLFQYSNYGACSNYSFTEIKGSIHQLIMNGEIENNDGLISLLKKSTDEHNEKVEKTEEKTVNLQNNHEDTLELFNKLRQVRKEASQKFSQTPNLICPDPVLRKVAEERPQNVTDFLSITGTNQRMFNKIGRDILEVIQENPIKPKQEEKQQIEIPENVSETFRLMNKGYGIKDIAELKKVPETVVSLQIETIIQYYPTIDIEFLFGGKEFSDIKSLYTKGITNMREIKESLPGNISYSKIRIALAKIRAN